MDIHLKETIFFSRSEVFNGLVDIELQGIEKGKTEVARLTWKGCSIAKADVVEEAFKSRKPVSFEYHMRYMDFDGKSVDLESL